MGVSHHENVSGRGAGPPPGLPRRDRFGLSLSGRQSRPSGGHAVCMSSAVNINDVLDGHVSLELECVDRLYLNAYVPRLQASGQVAYFFRDHLGMPIPSPAVMNQIGNRFRREVKAFAQDHSIPLLRLNKPDRTRWDDRKLDHVRPHLDRAEREGRVGVVAIVSAQEFAWVFSAKDRSSDPGRPYFEFVREQRRVGAYYFYVNDPEFGPGFVKIATYFPFPAKVWCNGHEWAKRQADHVGLPYRSLANGFASCEDPARLQAICDRFGPADVQGFFDRSAALIPTPLTRDGPGGGLLVGALHAPGRGVSHARLRRSASGPALLRVLGGRTTSPSVVQKRSRWSLPAG